MEKIRIATWNLKRRSPNGKFNEPMQKIIEVLCVGEPEEWRAARKFPIEETALEYYKTNIRPELEKMTPQMGKNQGA